jgi:hypothetical protein
MNEMIVGVSFLEIEDIFIKNGVQEKAKHAAFMTAGEYNLDSYPNAIGVCWGFRCVRNE